MKENSCPSENRKIRVLIISDRLTDEAKVLAGYLQCSGVIEVVGVARNRQQALGIAQENDFDYLIIAGYLRIEHNYGVIAELAKTAKGVSDRSVGDARSADFNLLPDGMTIPLKFERTLPLEAFIRFLDAHHTGK